MKDIMPQTTEQTRLLHDGLRWKHWGSYLSDSLPRQARGIAAAALLLFAPLMLAGQGYQESQLNQEAKSGVGAVGIMQLMPATGSEMKVGDVKLAEPNIHAGVKYMDFLMSKNFPDAKFSERDRSFFAFASYNADRARSRACERQPESAASIPTCG